MSAKAPARASGKKAGAKAEKKAAPAKAAKATKTAKKPAPRAKAGGAAKPAAAKAGAGKAKPTAKPEAKAAKGKKPPAKKAAPARPAAAEAGPRKKSAGLSGGALRARVLVYPRREILDPQGKAIRNALAGIGFDQVEEVRAGKSFEITLSAKAARAGGGERSRELLTAMCERLLANSVVEDYAIELPGEVPEPADDGGAEA